MDGSDKDIVLDKEGICNHCHQAQKMLKEINEDQHLLTGIIKQIKKDGKKNTYDILIGLSGGVDSSTVLHWSMVLGLRPLCFSVDNGWNSVEADENIMRLVEGLKVPFYRYVLDVKKFKELQGAFMKAGVPNIEIPTDHVLMAASYELAAKYNIKWIVSGGNVATESIMPKSWGYDARDLTHIKDVYKKMIGKPLTGIPVCGLLKWNYYKWVKRIQVFYLLDYLAYNRENSIKLLQNEYGYKPYGLKHGESTFTAWFQNFYLFEKFGFDKRKPHFSSMINSGQMSRKEAKALLLEKPVFPRLGLEERVLKYKKRSHDEFKKDEWLWKLISSFIRFLRNANF